MRELKINIVLGGGVVDFIGLDFVITRAVTKVAHDNPTLQYCTIPLKDEDGTVCGELKIE